MNMELLIRDAEAGDAEAITRILNPIIEARLYTAFDTVFSVDVERAYIANLSQRGIWKVAVNPSDHRLVGFQMCTSPLPHTRARSIMSGRSARTSTLRADARALPRACLPRPCRGAREGLREILHLRAGGQPRGAADLHESGLCCHWHRPSTGKDRWPLRGRSPHREVVIRTRVRVNERPRRACDSSRHRG